jgi:glycosyltransferase involved in cell wall biosynthesis
MKPQIMPKISVIIPLYNAEQYIARTLYSVLNQTYPDFEVIIVDDGSIDLGIEICQSFNDSRIKIIRQGNRGLPGARNTGIRHAQGDYIALLDSDDLWSPHKLDRHVAHLEQEPTVGISFCYSEFIDESDNRLGLYQKSKRLTGITPDYILCRNPVGNGSSAVIRRSVLHDIEFQAEIQGKIEPCYFDEHLRERHADATDVEFWLRTCITTKWRITGIPEVLTYYRINGGGLSANALQQLHALDRVIEKTRTYAPDIIARCESLARAYHFRYTARRLVTLGESKTAVKMLHSSLRSDWRIIRDEPLKTLLTALAVYFMQYLPTKLYRPLHSLAMLAIARPSQDPEANPS